MTAIPQKKQYTITEYLELEATADYKNEYYFGEIFAMAGGTPQHSELCSNVGWAIKNALRDKPCKVYNSDLQVELSAKGHYKYPDLTVICDQPKRSDKNKNALTNPMLIVEVLSEGTADYDKKDKFFSYCQIPSFQEYVLIYTDMALVLVYTKQTNSHWHLKDYMGLESIARFESIEADIPLSLLYEGLNVLTTVAEITTALSEK